MSILDTIFNSQPKQAPQQQQAPQDPQQQQQDPSQAMPNSAQQNNTIPNSNTTVPNNGMENNQSPLAEYGDIWQTKSNENNSKDFAINQEKLTEMASKMNFMGGVTPEQLAAVGNGGDEAVNAITEILNKVGQTSFARALEASSHLTNTALRTSNDSLQTELPKLVRNVSVSNNLRAENPMFNDPAVAPLLGAVEQQLANKYPDATAEEVTAHARKYLEQVAGVFNPNLAKQENNQQGGKTIAEEDFSGLLGL
jgi:hypothetical protein